MAEPLVLPDGVSVGRHSYGFDAATFQIFMVGARIDLGAFCSLGPEVRLLAGSEHVITRASTFPLKSVLVDPAGGNGEEAIDRGVTSVGNDVWMGLRATVMSGVRVGHGAVVGAGAVVTGDVDPYAIVAGNPARVLRFRFESEIRERLLALHWWDWSDDTIRARIDWFMGDVERFLERAERAERGAATAPGSGRGWLSRVAPRAARR